MINEEQLISELTIALNDGERMEPCRVRAVRVRGTLYLAHKDLLEATAPKRLPNLLVRCSDLCRSFTSFADANMNVPSVELTDVHRKLVAAHDEALATGKFISASDFAKLLLARGSQNDQLIWELLRS